MRLSTLLREALASAWAAKIPSVLIVLVTAAMCAAPIMTVGKSAAAAAALQQRMEQAGARRLVVIDASQAGFINPRTLAQVSDLNTVDSAAALGAPFDTVNGVIGPGGTPTPSWPVLGPITEVATLVQGRWPQPGEMIVSTTALTTLGLTAPVGYLASPDGRQQWPIVGSFTPTPGYDDLATGALTPATTPIARELRVTIDTIASAAATVQAVLAILDPQDPQGVHVESPTSIAKTAQDLNAQLAGYGRSLLLMILGGGALFVAAVVLADVLVRRKDLGRRRTLGITRSDLTTLVTLRVITMALLGATLGCGVAVLMNARTGIATPVNFTTAVGILVITVAGLATLAPALYAAHRDPVTVMRTP